MPAANHDFTQAEIKAGALVLACLVVLVAFVAAIQGFRPKDDSAKRYFASFSNISGLNVGADARFGGVKAGKVVAIRSDPEDRSLIQVEIEVGGEFPVNEGSLASTEQISLTAEKHIEISTGSADLPLLSDGDVLAVNAGAGGLFDIPDIEGVITRLETLLDSVITIVGVEKARAAVNGDNPEIVDATQITAALKTALSASGDTARALDETLVENRESIHQVLTGLALLESQAGELIQQMSGMVSENRGPLHASMTNLESLTNELNSEIEQLSSSLNATLQNLEGLSANSNDLLEQERLTIEEIVANLQQTTRNLKELSRTLADQPEALLRGKGRQGRTYKEKP